MNLLILLTIGFFMTVQGNPISTSETNEENLRAVAQRILDQIQPLLHDADEIKEKGKTVHEEMRQKSGQFFSMFDEFPEVIELKESLKNAVSKGKNVDECQKLLDNKLYWAGVNLQQDYYDSVEGSLKAINLSFMFMRARLESVKEALEMNLEEELNICKKDSSKCQITGSFIEMTDEYFKMIDNLKEQVPLLVENTINFLKLKEASKEINKKVVPAVNKCLKK